MPAHHRQPPSPTGQAAGRRFYGQPISSFQISPMRILFLSHYYPPEGNAPATRVSALARRWVAGGHEVTVVTCVPNVPDGVVYGGYRNRLWPREAVVDGVRVIRVWTWIASNKGTVRRIVNYLSYMVMAWLRVMLLARPDILIATSPQFFCGWAGVLGAWGMRVRNPFCRLAMPFVLEIRDIWPESIGAVDAMGNATVLRVLEWMELRMYAAADHVVTVGPGYKRRLRERGVPEEKISIVQNGMDRDLLEAAALAPVAVRREWGVEGKFVCSYIGTIGMACGLEILIRAGQKLRDTGRDDIVFLVIGDGAVRRHLEAEAINRGLDNVRFLGRQAKESIPGFLALTDACLVHLRKSPLFESVMPSKIFEAAGMRRPILNGVNGDARKLIEQADCGLIFEPEDENGLINQLRRLVDNPDLARRLGNNGHRFVTTHFDRDQLAHDYESLLKKLIAR